MIAQIIGQLTMAVPIIVAMVAIALLSIMVCILIMATGGIQDDWRD